MYNIAETTLPLHKRINIHRRDKSGCEYVIRHFKDVCFGASFSFQIIEVFPCTGYKNNKVCPVNRETMLDAENYWIETLRTSYPYGLNESKRETDPNLPVACSFPPIPRSGQRSVRCRNNVNFDNLKDMESTFNCIHNYITDDIKNSLCHIRIFLNHTRRKYFTKIAFEIILNVPFIRIDLTKFQYYSFILDTIDTKLYKPEQTKQKKQIPKYSCTVKFDNKASELIRLAQIFNLPEVVFHLPDKLKKNRNNLTITYQLGKTIRMKRLNYKEAVNSIYLDENFSFCFNADQRDCAGSSFCDPHLNHIITRDL